MSFSSSPYNKPTQFPQAINCMLQTFKCPLSLCCHYWLAKPSSSPATSLWLMPCIFNQAPFLIATTSVSSPEGSLVWIGFTWFFRLFLWRSTSCRDLSLLDMTWSAIFVVIITCCHTWGAPQKWCVINTYAVHMDNSVNTVLFPSPPTPTCTNLPWP